MDPKLVNGLQVAVYVTEADEETDVATFCVTMPRFADEWTALLYWLSEQLVDRLMSRPGSVTTPADIAVAIELFPAEMMDWTPARSCPIPLLFVSDEFCLPLRWESKTVKGGCNGEA